VNDFLKVVEHGLRRYRRGDREEVFAEITAHLEDIYAEAVESGLDPSQAREAALASVGEWTELSRELQAAKGEDMNGRMKKIFIPGLVAMLIGSIGDRLLWWTHSSMPNIYWIGRPTVPGGARGFIAIEPLMLVFLVIGGAAAAWLSRQMDGSRRQRIYAAELPVMVTGGLMVLSLSLNLLFGPFVRSLRGEVSYMMYAFFGYIIGWVLLPAVALYVGALPFTRERSSSPPMSAA